MKKLSQHHVELRKKFMKKLLLKPDNNIQRQLIMHPDFSPMYQVYRRQGRARDMWYRRAMEDLWEEERMEKRSVRYRFTEYDYKKQEHQRYLQEKVREDNAKNNELREKR